MTTETLVSHDAPTPVPAALRNRSEFLEELARRGARSPDLLGAFEDMVSLVGCLMALDDDAEPDRWRREREGYDALARARRSLHRCAMSRGLV
jgi:hypothetical protein